MDVIRAVALQYNAQLFSLQKKRKKEMNRLWVLCILFMKDLELRFL